MADVYALMWEEREGASLCGVFNTPEEAKKHLDGEVRILALKQNANIAMWQKLATETAGNDRTHALHLAKCEQDMLDAGLVDELKSSWKFNPYDESVVQAWGFCRDHFSISKWEIGAGKKF